MRISLRVPHPTSISRGILQGDETVYVADLSGRTFVCREVVRCRLAPIM